MKRMALIFFTLLLCCNAFCGTRRALVVFVGDYPTDVALVRKEVCHADDSPDLKPAQEK